MQPNKERSLRSAYEAMDSAEIERRLASGGLVPLAAEIARSELENRRARVGADVETAGSLVSNKAKKSRIAIFVALVVFGVWFFSTPYLAARAMKSAVDAGNASELSDYMDYPAIRQSMKESVRAFAIAKAASDPKREGDAARFAAQLSALMDPMIDAVVKPEVLAMLMQAEAKKTTAGVDFAKLRESLKTSYGSGRGHDPFGDLMAAVAVPLIEATVTSEVLGSQMDRAYKESPQHSRNAKATMSYESFNRFVVNLPETDASVGLVMTRQNMFFWRLSAVRLQLQPPRNREK